MPAHAIKFRSPPPLPVFAEGHVYSVKTKNGSENSGMNVDFLFRYEGKQGIHHMFREVRGGWSRTYTDYQLIGKKVKEVIA